MQNEIMVNKKTELIIYESKNCDIKLDVSLKNETVWLIEAQIALIFNRDEKVLYR